MRRPVTLPIIACLTLTLAGVARSQDLDLPVPPDAGVVSPDGFVPEGIGIPEHVPEYVPEGVPFGPPCCSMIDHPPTPVPYPGLELWEGFCNHHDGLAGACGDCKPCMWGAIDAVWLARDIGEESVVLVLNGADERVLSSSDFDFDDEPGIRLTYGRVVCCTPVEFTYFGSVDWSSTIGVESEEDDADLFVPIGAIDNGAFEEADFVGARYRTELESFELNALCYDCCNDITALGGVRFIAIDERFDLFAFDNDDGIGELRIDADNYLLGVQGGGAFERTCGRWTWGAIAKAGVFLNFSDASYRFHEDDEFDSDLDVTESASQDDDAASFVGEAILGGSYCLGAGFSVRGGYQLTWVHGVVLAPEQFGNEAAVGDGEFVPPDLDADGEVLYDGAYLGLHWTR